jgi:hypothetical protein
MSEGAIFRTAPIEMVHAGMAVVDNTGDRLGKVEMVHMGDPGASTTRGNEPRPENFAEKILDTFNDEDAEPDVPEPLRSQLVREGYVKIDGPGIFDTDRYLRSDQIGRVVDDVVHVRVSRVEIAREGGGSEERPRP